MAASIENKTRHANIKTISATQIIDNSVIQYSEKIYTDQTRIGIISQFFEKREESFLSKSTLIITLKNHERHQSLTEIYSSNCFNKKLDEFVSLKNIDKLFYYSNTMLEMPPQNTYYVDTLDGKKVTLILTGLENFVIVQ